MRTTIVPAQVTTVEDRVIGNMSGMQSALLIVTTICATATYSFLPPFFSYDSYKLVPILCIATACGLLAIKIRQMLILKWIIVIGHYMLRPKYYILDKRSTHLRDVAVTPIKKDSEVVKSAEPLRRVISPPKNLTIHEAIAVDEFVTNPQTNLHIKTDRKGKISVHFNEA